jgi:hypothetical protein
MISKEFPLKEIKKTRDELGSQSAHLNQNPHSFPTEIAQLNKPGSLLRQSCNYSMQTQQYNMEHIVELRQNFLLL